MDILKIKIFKKYFINESGGVNDNLKDIVNDIIQLILNDYKKRKKYISNIYNIPYVENDEGVKYNVVLNKNQNCSIIVKYVLYFAESEEERRNILKITKINFNSSWDEENKTMSIVDVLVNGQFNNNFFQTVEHEAEHMYEYAMGMHKNKTLYDKTVDLMQKGQDNIYSYYVGAAFYYTFKHEQEAFKQQFYIYLNQLNKKITFDNALNNYVPFKKMNNMYDAVYDNEDNENLMKAINELGFSRRDYFKRLYYQYNRFLLKLKQCYLRWWNDNKERFLTQEEKVICCINKFSQQMELSEGKTFIEKEKNKIKYKNEFFI